MQFPIGQWVFLALTSSTILQKQNGFRYTLPSTSTQTVILATRGATSSFYNLSLSATVYIGDDNSYNIANAWLHYVRLYLNYFPNSEEEMLNLATLDSGNILRSNF